MARPTDITIDNDTGAAVRTDVNNVNAGLASNHIGNGQPSYIVTGMDYIDNNASIWQWLLYDGGADIHFMDIDPATNKTRKTNNLDAVDLDDLPTAAQIQNGATTYCGTATGTNALAASPSIAPTAYAAGQRFSLITAAQNTGAMTVNIATLGAKNLKKIGGNNTASGDVPAGALIEFEYNGTDFILLSATRIPVLADLAVKERALASPKQDLGNISGATAIDLDNGRYVTYTPTATTTFTVSNAKASDQVDYVRLRSTDAGAETVNLPGTITWLTDDGFAPDFTTSGDDEILLVTDDGFTTSLGFVIKTDI
jgi:hypothetical protein